MQIISEVILLPIPLFLLLFVVCVIYWALLKIINFSRKQSRSFQNALALIGFTALLLWFIIPWYESKPNWTSYSLNPDYPNLNPKVVILAGTYSDSRYRRVTSGRFEIRMRGFTNYFAARWNTSSLTPHPGTDFEIWVPGKFWNINKRSAHGRSRGGGSGGEIINPAELPLLIGQSFWDQDQFVGALTNRVTHNSRTLICEDLEQFGKFQIPRKIQVFDHGKPVGTYVIKRVEFLHLPRDDWFQEVAAKKRFRFPKN